MKKLVFFLLFLLIIACNQAEENKLNDLKNPAAEKFLQVHNDYVSGWLAMDEKQVMGLLEEEAMIQPNRMKPIEGKENIRDFWFPKDSSKTTIVQYDTEIMYLELMDSIALTTHSSLLNWDYQKDSLSFGMIQQGFNTTIYRRQPDATWKIWRSMWTDTSSKKK